MDTVSAVGASLPATRAAPRAAAERAWVERAALAVVYAVSAGSLAGFATFGLRPERLTQVPGAAAAYGWMMAVAPRAQSAGARWLPALGALYVLSLASELSGTTVGLPFGPNHYTPGLGTKWFGHVPVLIPLSWFFMALPSYAIAWRGAPEAGRGARRVLLGSLVLLSWDLALDPAMSLVTKYWVWGTEGPYYGMPLLNLAGWYVTGLALMLALEALRAGRWVARLPLGWLAGFYGANLLLPLGMCVAAGLWGAAAATVAALAGCWLLARPADARREREVAA
jgi:uncharacterized membrane protein